MRRNGENKPYATHKLIGLIILSKGGNLIGKNAGFFSLENAMYPQ